MSVDGKYIRAQEMGHTAAASLGYDQVSGKSIRGIQFCMATEQQRRQVRSAMSSGVFITGVSVMTAGSGPSARGDRIPACSDDHSIPRVEEEVWLARERACPHH